MTIDAAWTELRHRLSECETLEGAIGLLGWDQNTMMPRASGGSRAEQTALLSSINHERFTHPRIGELLHTLESEASDHTMRRSAFVVRRNYDRATKVDARLVSELASAQSAAFDAWVQAKRTSDFATFAPHLERLVTLNRERISAIDASRHPYDVLLDEYDPGTSVASLRAMFGRLQPGLTELITAIQARPQLPAVEASFPIEAQRRIQKVVAERLGYDFERGRLDDAEHPFSIALHPTDVRITTHLYADNLLSGLGGTIHETGHALYEQGLPTELRGTSLARAASYGVHESQSRFWENYVGRSEAFAHWLAPHLRDDLGADAPDAGLIFRANNRVVPGLIRIRADEVTYNLHIIVRFEVELALLEGRVAIADLPEMWNSRYREYLGVNPPNDAEGILQDVHWSMGAFAYFPSYTLGNLYAASIGRHLEAAMPTMWDDVGRGDFSAILGWLRQNIHQRGSALEAPQLIEAAVGSRDAVDDLLHYLWHRVGGLYGVTR
jgi:carboxypeptidase Taq